MIARVWHGRTTIENADAYVAHLRRVTLPRLGALDGHAGASILRRDGDHGVEFIVITLWASTDAIRAFAGDDYEAAVIPAEARRLLNSFDDRATHYVVVDRH